MLPRGAYSSRCPSPVNHASAPDLLQWGRVALAKGRLERPLLYVVYLLYCVEAGVFLVLVPWSLVWVNSYFAQMSALRPFLLSGFLRGAISALGLLHLIVAAVDFLAFRRALKGP